MLGFCHIRIFLLMIWICENSRIKNVGLKNDCLTVEWNAGYLETRSMDFKCKIEKKK